MHCTTHLLVRTLPCTTHLLVRTLPLRLARVAGGERGLTGATGPAGTGVSLITIEAAQSVVAGQPVITRAGDGLLELAGAASFPVAQAFGVAITTALAGFVADVRTLGPITLADWTAITGTATLTRGADYYLSTTAGTLTTVPPSASGQFVVRVGRCATADTLDIHIHQSIRKA